MNVEDLGRRRRRLLVRSVSTAQGEPFAAEHNNAPPDSGEMAVSAFTQSLWAAPSLSSDHQVPVPGPLAADAYTAPADPKKPSPLSRALAWLPGAVTAPREQAVVGPARVEAQHLDSVLQALGASSFSGNHSELSALERPQSPLPPESRSTSLKKSEGLDSQGRVRVPGKFFVPRPTAPEAASSGDASIRSAATGPLNSAQLTENATARSIPPVAAITPPKMLDPTVTEVPAAPSNLNSQPQVAATPVVASTEPVDVPTFMHAAQSAQLDSEPAAVKPVAVPQLDPVFAALQKLAELAAVVTPAVTPLSELQKSVCSEPAAPVTSTVPQASTLPQSSLPNLRIDRPGAQRSRAKLAVLHQEAAALSTRISELASLVDQCSDDSAEDSLIAWDDCRRLAAILHQELERGLPLPEFQATR